MLFEALYYDGWSEPPAYFLIGVVEGETPEEALKENLPKLIATVREMFDLDESVSDTKISETLYLLRPGGLVSTRDFTVKDSV